MLRRSTLWNLATRCTVLLTVMLFAVQEVYAQKPNIVYILADDLGYGDLGCYGGKIIQTPRIDQLRAEGMKFTQHYAGCSMCAPTRCSLLTGLHTGHCRVRANSGYLQPGRVELLPEDETIAELLKAAGYTSAVIGKWGLGEQGTTGVPNKQGFDFWFGYLNQSNAHHYYPPFLWKNEQKVLFPENPTSRTHYSHDLFTEHALNFINDHRSEPFFLYLAYTIPHVDLDVPDDSKEPYVGVIQEAPPYGTPGGQHYRYEERPHATFAGMVSRLDRDVGRIVDRLDELGLSQNTLIIFTSDNGPTSAGGADPNFFDGNGPLRGIKFEFYEGGIRVPMIARWSGTISSGSESEHISAHWDMLPTFADLAGIDTPKGLDGISMLAALKGEPQQQHESLYWESYNLGGVQAMRSGKWKALRKGIIGNPEAPIELYDLENDLAESHNVAATYPAVAQQMKEDMLANHRPNEHYDFVKAPKK